MTKLSPAGNALVYSTYLGGGDWDQGTGIAVDPNGSAYVTGHTESSDFPTAGPYQSDFGGGITDAFVAKLGFEINTDVGDDYSMGLPRAFALHQNYPNPFNAGTVIRYTLLEESRVVVEVFDILGRHVAELVNGVQSPGVHAIRWSGELTDGGRAASGMYFYRLRANGYEETKKMIMLK